MSHEFNDSEMYYCDICGEYLPLETMYELEDGRIVCEYCLEGLEVEEWVLADQSIRCQPAVSCYAALHNIPGHAHVQPAHRGDRFCYVCIAGISIGLRKKSPRDGTAIMLNPHHFSRIFKKVSGMTPWEFIS